jgi:hypothetical protein
MVTRTATHILTTLTRIHTGGLHSRFTMDLDSGGVGVGTGRHTMAAAGPYTAMPADAHLRVTEPLMVVM